jgi:hypothetical protein
VESIRGASPRDRNRRSSMEAIGADPDPSIRFELNRDSGTYTGERQ